MLLRSLLSRRKLACLMTFAALGVFLKPADCAPTMRQGDDATWSARSGLNFRRARINRSDSMRRYRVLADYPLLAPTGNGPNDTFNAEVTRQVNLALREFHKNAADYFEKDKDKRKYSIEVKGRVAYATPRLLSVLLDSTVDYGGAHPGSTTASVNGDLRNGRVLQLGDLFRPHTAYLPALSSICRRALSAKLSGSDKTTLTSGTAPKAANFRVWHFTPDGIEILFPPYQVASYAEGPQQVMIPYARLNGLLRPEYAAAH